MKTIDREAQMKYDIVRNEDGPLKRTMKVSETKGTEKGKSAAIFSAGTEDDAAMSSTPKKHFGLDERLNNIEKHLAVRYGFVFMSNFFHIYLISAVQFHPRRSLSWTA